MAGVPDRIERKSGRRKAGGVRWLASTCLLALLVTPASSETLIAALASAYASNPEINAARAGVRSTDELLPQAKSFYRPNVSLDAGLTGRIVNSGAGSNDTTDDFLEGSVGIAAEQFLFRGFRTRNGVRSAEANILASREGLRNTVQNILFDTAEAYFDVILNARIVEIRRGNIFFLEEQLRSAQAQFNLGESTVTDVAQTRAELGLVQSDLATAQASLREAQARYRRLVGHEPRGLQPEFPFKKLAAASLPAALAISQKDHPAILSGIYQADAAAFDVKQVEGELLPTVTLGASLDRDFGIDDEDFTNNAAVQIRVSVPIYQGGAVASRVRQAKEVMGQRRIEVDLYRDQVRAAVEASWAQIEAYQASVVAARSQIEASGSALSGAQEEQQVGQRTRLDVLDAQRTLRLAEESALLAQRNLALGYFSLSSAMGRLSAEFLDLPVPVYRPQDHYAAVKDKWHGLRTPDGR